MNDRDRAIILEEMNRRAANSSEKIKRRKIVKIQKIIIKTMVIIAIIGVVAFVGVKLWDKFSKSEVTESGAESGIADKSATGDYFGLNSDLASSGDSMASLTDADDDREKDFEINLTFAGDCCMASEQDDQSEGNMRWYSQNYPTSYFFEKVVQYFEGDDLTVVNCENAFTDKASEKNEKEEGPQYWFKAPTSFAKVFSDNNIEMVSLANNHTLDYGEEGYEDTKAALDAAGVQWGSWDKIQYFEKDGFTIAFVFIKFFNQTEFENNMTILDEAVKNSDYQIVFFHAGAEGEFFIYDWVIEKCHAYVDRGADLMVGSHPHVLEKRENYNGVDIVYSMGNFCFGGNVAPKSNRTIIYKYKLHIQGKGKDLQVTDKEEEFIPCYVHTGTFNNWQPAPIEDPEIADRVVRFMNGELDTPE